MCTGAFLLGDAGLISGRHVTTHWQFAPLLAERFPDAKVDDDRVFVRDGALVTSAGSSAAIDLGLSLVEEDLGRDVSLYVARRLVVFLKRPGDQSQFSVHLAAQAVGRSRLYDVQQYILKPSVRRSVRECSGEDRSYESRETSREFSRKRWGFHQPIMSN